MAAPQLELSPAESVDKIASEWLASNPEFETKIRKALLCNSCEVRLATAEAMRFLWLVANKNSPGMLTPSHRVDLVWHEMILFTRSYAQLCETEFGRFIHHQPGGTSQSNRRQFEETLNAYSAAFGEPPESFWGCSAQGESACGPCEGL